MALSDYELSQLEKVREHKERELRSSPRRLVPEAVREKGAEWFSRTMKNPAAAKAKDTGAEAFKAAAAGAGKFMTRSAQLTTSEKRIIRAYTKRATRSAHLMRSESLISTRSTTSLLLLDCTMPTPSERRLRVPSPDSR